MKNQCIFLISLVLATSCTKPKIYHQRINDIPASAPNYNADIRFAGQNSPQNPYFEIVDINIIEKGSLNKNQIKNRLEQEAIREGIDGVMNVESWVDSENVSNLFTIILDVIEDDGETTTVIEHHTYITGKGFIYLESLDNIAANPEYEYFYIIDLESDFPKPFFKIEYRLTGQEYMVYPESDEALEIYKKYIQYYSEFHLHEQRENWSYLMKDSRVSKRIFRYDNGFISKICLPKYDEKGRCRQVKIVHRNSSIENNEMVNYIYDEKGRVSGRVVDMHDGTKICEEYQYLDGKISGRNILINIPHKGQVKLRTSFHYYAPDYLKDYYFQELANKRDK